MHRSRALKTLVAALLAAAAAPAGEPAEKERSEREREERRAERPREEKRGEKKAGDDEVLYALGAILGSKAQHFRLAPRELEIVKRGFIDAATGRKLRLAEGDLEEWGPRVDALGARRVSPELAAEKERASKLLDAAAREPGAVRLPSGVVVRTLAPGTGPTPAAGDKVRVQYEGRLADGTVFDSSRQRGGPADVPLGGVIPCWREGVQRMKVGEKARVHCPPALAYGDTGHPPLVPAGAALVFEVELLEIHH